MADGPRWVARITQAGVRWESDPGVYKERRSGTTSAHSFTYMALRFFRFHSLIDQPRKPRTAADATIEEFGVFLKNARGMEPETIRGYSARIKNFLSTFEGAAQFEGPEQLAQVCLQDIDVFLQMKLDKGYSPRTIISFCMALRMFFQYAEIRGWNKLKISEGIQKPRLARTTSKPTGPSWKDVRRLLTFQSNDRPAALRAAAIISMCAIYGMRSCEVVNLKLHDFDWVGETFTVIRAKGGRIQQFPIQYEVGETILRYLQFGRPKCPCRHLLVTIHPPYRPVRPATIWGIVADRMKRVDINSERYGGHSLRHACATQLLRKGSSLRDIADFLGHTTLNSVSIYAKHDIRSLRLVAAFGLRSQSPRNMG
jgi:integrase/recombinase XerD